MISADTSGVGPSSGLARACAVAFIARRALGWIGKTAAVVALALSLLAVSPQAVSAHGDVSLIGTSVTLEAGESRQFPGDVHYHRLVGRVRAESPIYVRMVDARSGNVVVEYGPETSLSFNELIRCCDDTGWAPHLFVLENASDRAVVVDVVARLVHDDLAVMVDGAEEGTRVSVALFGMIWGAVLWRVGRRRKPPISINRAAVVTGILAVLVILVSFLGMIRYGDGGPGGFLAGLSDLSLMPYNPAASGVSILIAILLFSWGAAGVWWMRSGPVTEPIRWTALGMVLIAMVIVAAVLIGRTYESAAIPVAIGLVAIVPLSVVMLKGLRQAPLEQPAPDTR